MESAIIGAVALVVGTLLGSWLQGRAQSSVVERDIESRERTQLHGERVQAYADYELEALHAFTEMSNGRPMSSDRDDARHRAYFRCQLLAEQVTLKAITAVGTYLVHIGRRRSGVRLTEEECDEYGLRSKRMQLAMRRDLGIKTDADDLAAFVAADDLTRP